MKSLSKDVADRNPCCHINDISINANCYEKGPLVELSNKRRQLAFSISKISKVLIATLAVPELDVMLGVGVHVAVELHARVEPHRVEEVGLGPAGWGV